MMNWYADRIDEVSDLLDLLEKYLAMPSLDGRLERQGLRKEMSKRLEELRINGDDGED